MKKVIVCLMIGLSWAGFSVAAGNAEAGKAKVATCSGCHGADGNSVIPSFPKLAGQGEVYLTKQLIDIRDGGRQIAAMTGILTGKSDQDLADMAAFYASQEISQGQTDAALFELGQKIYRAGIPSKGVASCTACHSPTGAGNAQAGFPALGGQHAEYIASSLKAYRAGTRVNGSAALMQQVAAIMSDAEIEAVSSYIAGLSDQLLSATKKGG